MKRGTDEAPQADTAARRNRRRVVNRVHTSRLRTLRERDLYRLGDVSRRVLAAEGVELPVPNWQLHRARVLLGARYDEVARSGLVAVLVADGLPTVASVRQRLLRTPDATSNSAFDDALAAFHDEAARARDAELEWLAANLCCDGSAVGSTRILHLWFSSTPR